MSLLIIRFADYLFGSEYTNRKIKSNLNVIANAIGVMLKKQKKVKVSTYIDRPDGVVVRASASQSVDMGFILLVESHQKTLKNGIHSFPAWLSAFRGL